jgi:large-conductance mechanosensitive channel
MNKTKSSFLEFLSNNNVIATIIATMISQRITDVSNAIIDCLILPILNRDADGDGEADIKDIKEYELNLSGIKFKLGEFLIVILKFLIILFIVYQINKIMKKLV